nr:hypothetical protein HmN_000601900 [Hymenolepis microstoma]CUU98948.1 hypothetical transcript [Hymenolepis microstoma]
MLLRIIEKRDFKMFFFPSSQHLKKLSSFASIFAKVVKENSALWISCCSYSAFGTHLTHRELALKPRISAGIEYADLCAIPTSLAIFSMKRDVFLIACSKRVSLLIGLHQGALFPLL